MATRGGWCTPRMSQYPGRIVFLPSQIGCESDKERERGEDVPCCRVAGD